MVGQRVTTKNSDIHVPFSRLIEGATGAMWKIHQDSIAVNLYPDTPEGRSKLEKEELMRKAGEKERDEQKVRMGL